MASADDVQKLAALARIHIPDDTLSRFVGDFDAILSYIAQLEELKIDHRDTASLPAIRNVFREDGNAHESGIYTEKLAAQFPAREGNALSVKQIISHD